MNQKIAIPTVNKILCAHFGHCEAFALYDVSEGSVIQENFVVPPPHEPGLLPGWLAAMGVTHVIAGGMGQRAVSLFNSQGIETLVGAEARPARELVESFLRDQLVSGQNACDH